MLLGGAVLANVTLFGAMSWRTYCSVVMFSVVDCCVEVVSVVECGGMVFCVVQCFLILLRVVKAAVKNETPGLWRKFWGREANSFLR